MTPSYCDATCFAAVFMASTIAIVLLDAAIAGFVLFASGRTKRKGKEEDEDIRD